MIKRKFIILNGIFVVRVKGIIGSVLDVCVMYLAYSHKKNIKVLQQNLVDKILVNSFEVF